MRKFYSFGSLSIILLLSNSILKTEINLTGKNYSPTRIMTSPDSVILNSGTINLTIPDFNANGVSHTLTASGIPITAVIDSVIATFTISHAYPLDLVVNLEAPNGQIINLAAYHDNADDPPYANTRITSNNSYAPLPPDSTFGFSFTYRADAKSQATLDGDPNNEGIQTTPSVTTSSFNNLYPTPTSANGNWKIRAYDVFTGDEGTLISWSLKIRYTITSPTPVTLFNFSGYKENDHNILKWSTASEQNCKGFQLERSLNGMTYSSIGFVQSQATSGYSNLKLNYSFIDNSPSGNRQYYRLRQIDFDGNEKLSNIILIKGIQPKEFSIDAVFPNPVNTSLNVFVNSPRHDEILLQVLSMNGQLLKQKNSVTENGSNTVSIDVSALKSGTYLLKIISSTGEIAASRFIKQ